MNVSELAPLFAVLAVGFALLSAVLGRMVWSLRFRLNSLTEDRAELKARAATLDTNLALTTDKLKVAAAAGQKNYTAWLQESALRREVERREQTAAEKLQQFDTTTAERDRLADELKRCRRLAARHRRQARELGDQITAATRQDGRVWLAPVPPEVPAFRPPAERKAVIIAVANLKGGVGKTTITANLGGYFGAAGKRVLMIDLDHQRSLSQMLLSGTDRELLFNQGRTVQHFLAGTDRSAGRFVGSLSPVTGAKNCQLVINGDPAQDEGEAVGLDDVEQRLMFEWALRRNRGAEDVRFLLRRPLHDDAVAGQFDYVLLDCPPRLTTACVGALAASDFVLIPVAIEEVAIRSVYQMLRWLRRLITAGVCPQLRILGVVANSAPERIAKTAALEHRLWKRVADHASQSWGAPVPFFKAMLKRRLQYPNATRHITTGVLKLPIAYDAVRRDYEALAKEMEARIHESVRTSGVPS